MTEFTVIEWFGDCECCASEKEVGKFPTFALAWLGATIYARDEYGVDLDIGQPNIVNEFATQEWSGFVGLEIREVESE